MPGTDRNPIDAALATFLESPVMIIVGSCDDGLLPQVARAAGAVDLVDVHGAAMSDPVSPSAMTARYVEIAFPFELDELLGRQPFH